ncbi:hypothetical protein MCC10015_1617 [Bifidobacterium longum subsp. longum]|uniref:Uncharacterized protein n=1 Tax=Bifidobacterium longum subsp. longum TaxID=1679 RepID=A0A4R0T3Z6_BIFLL|nr:hypothetical protein MCC10015_1617 [Bifidobacterium longum subsp. longum]
MLIPSMFGQPVRVEPSLSRRVNANSQPATARVLRVIKLIKKGEC